MLRKKIVLGLVVMIVMGLLSACGGTVSSGTWTTKGLKHTIADDKVTCSYDSVNGSRNYTKELKAGDSVAINVDTKAGALSFTLTEPSGDVVLTGDGKEGEVASFTYDVTADGKYVVDIKFTEHSGGFDIIW